VTLDIPPVYGTPVGGKDSRGKIRWQVTPKVLTVRAPKGDGGVLPLAVERTPGNPPAAPEILGAAIISPSTLSPEIRGKVTMKARVDLSADQIKTKSSGHARAPGLGSLSPRDRTFS